MIEDLLGTRLLRRRVWSQIAVASIARDVPDESLAIRLALGEGAWWRVDESSFSMSSTSRWQGRIRNTSAIQQRHLCRDHDSTVAVLESKGRVLRGCAVSQGFGGESSNQVLRPLSWGGVDDGRATVESFERYPSDAST